VFISYRLETAGWSVALDEKLSRQLGSDRVFRASRSILPGEDFANRINRAIRESVVMLPLIGPGWLGGDTRGRRRLDDPDDWVRREIATALGANVLLVPVVVDNAVFPSASELPAEIAALGRRQYLRLHHRSAFDDLRRIVDTLDVILGDTPNARCSVRYGPEGAAFGPAPDDRPDLCGDTAGPVGRGAPPTLILDTWAAGGGEAAARRPAADRLGRDVEPHATVDSRQ